MLRNIIIFYDYSSPPLDVYEIKKFCAKNNVDYSEVFYKNEKEVKDFYNNLTTTNISYMRDNGIVVNVPLQTIVIMCVETSTNTFIMKSGKQNILDLLLQHI